MAGMFGAQNIPMDDAAETIAIQRRMKLADALRQQSVQAPESKMVGNQLVAPSPLSHIARLLAGYQANKAETGAMDEASRYAQAKRERLAQTLAGIGPMDTPEAQQASAIKLMQDPETRVLAGQFMTGALSDKRMGRQFEHADQSQRAMFENQQQRDERLAKEREAERGADREWRAQQAAQDAALQRELAGMRMSGADKAPHVTSVISTTEGGQLPVMSDGTVGVPGVGYVPLKDLPDTIRNAAKLTKPTDDPNSRAAIEAAKKTGAATGEAQAALADQSASLPRLEEVVTELSSLGKKATYTMAGKLRDSARRQLDLGAGEGAIARDEYISKVDNEVLPLLRQTFGAQFTQKEGESLKATLGDPDKSPEEKDAVLRSFIATKRAQIGTSKRRVEAGKTDHSAMSDDELLKAINGD